MGEQHWASHRRIILILVCVLTIVGYANADEPSTTIELARLEKQFRTIADRVAPSVVAISTSSIVMDADQSLRSDSLNGEKLDSLLQRTTRTVGTAFCIDANGYFLTNEHVIGDTAQIWITTDDRKVYPAVVVGSDPRADLAVLKAPVKGVKPVQFAPGNSVQRGMWTIALGNPYGLAGSGEMSMSVGVVSATDRSLPKLASQERRLYTNLIQTTAEINPGNSGGPLFDLQGRVIGISTAVILPQKSTYGIGFAMPVNADMLTRVSDLKEGREIKYAYLGVMVSAPTVHQRRLARIDGETGVNIDAVEIDSPAYGVLKPADVVTEINGQKVSRSDQFVRLVGGSAVETPTKLTVRREGEAMDVIVHLRERELPSVAINKENQRIRWRGMLLGPIPAHWDFTPSRRPDHGLMVLGIDPESPMAREGIRSGAVISTVAGKPISGITDLQEILDQTPVELCKVELAPVAVQAVASGDSR